MWNCTRFWGFFASKFIKFGDLFAVCFLSFYLHTCQIKKSNVGVSEKTKESYVIANVECYQFFASSVDLKFWKFAAEVEFSFFFFFLPALNNTHVSL